VDLDHSPAEMESSTGRCTMRSGPRSRSDASTLDWSVGSDTVEAQFAAPELVPHILDARAVENFDPTGSAVLPHYLVVAPDDCAHGSSVRAWQEYCRDCYSSVAYAESHHNLKRARRIVIRIGVSERKYRVHWGDWHYAIALAGALRSSGHLTAVVCQNEPLPRELRDGYDVVLDIRGPGEYEPNNAVSVIWLISHPEAAPPAVLASYDVRLLASQRLVENARDAGLSAELLPQATDAVRFRLPAEVRRDGHSLAFVGSTRNVKRPVVEAAIKQALPIAIYGAGWRDRYGTIPNLIAQSIPNHLLPSLYSRAVAVLNDHLPTMKSWGIVSNRVFDVLACGGCLVTDTFLELEDLTQGYSVHAYRSVAELRDAVDSASAASLRDGTSLRMIESFGRAHSFTARARDIIAALDRADA
jgi:O-antigen biosynthesis protein